MKINTKMILLAAIGLQVVSWFDVAGLAHQYLPSLPQMSPLQTAQTVGSGILFWIYFSVEKESAKQLKT